MYYKIVAIKDRYGDDKKDRDAVARIGRVMSIKDTNDIEIGKRLYIECVYPSYFKSIITSNVVRVEPSEDLSICDFILVTENSNYLFKKAKFDKESYVVDES